MAARTEDEQKELVRIWDAQEKELAELGRKIKDLGHIGRYLDEDVLSIERVQYLNHDVVRGKVHTGAAWKKEPWATSRYILTTATGGPHVEFDTNHLISVFWAGGIQEYSTNNKDAIDAIDAIAEYMDQMYSR